MTTTDDLKLKYKELLGTEFQGTYKGEFTMPQTGNERAVLSIDANSSFATTLCEISKEVLKEYGERVWKGITGPGDSFRYTDYWLWVEPDGFNEELLEGFSYKFSIARCSPFKCGDGTFTHGVSIKVSKL